MRRAAAAAAWAAIACQAQLLVPTNGSARRSVPKCKNEGPTTWRCSNWRGVLPQLCRWPEVPPLAVHCSTLTSPYVCNPSYQHCCRVTPLAAREDWVEQAYVGLK